MTEKFKILSAREHTRTRVGMYLGSTSREKADQFILGKWTSIEYVPALSKMINEILDNSIDEAIRTNFKFANKIDVTIDINSVTVTDNGRGIPQKEVFDAQLNKNILQPVAAWTQVNSGTSFEENRVTAGANGVGSATTNFMCSKFHGQTWQNGNLVEVFCTDGALNIDVSHKKKAGHGTIVSFEPDFSFFEVDSFQELDTISLIEDRLVGLQMAFPEIIFSFGGKKIQVRDIKAYANMFAVEGASVILEKSDNLSFFFTSSDDGFHSNSFVNGINTRIGGTYVDFIVNQVVDELLVLIKKKHKIDVGRSVVKNGFNFISFARNFNNPKYDSQIKERLTNTAGEVKTHFEENCKRDFKYLAKRIFAAQDIIEPIIAAQIAKKNADDRRDAIVAQKRLKKVRVAKHIAANKQDQATLFLVEGDSALGFLINVRDTDTVGAYPLRGVVMNTWDMKPADVLKNKELSELIAILGLDINNPDSIDNMNYKNIASFCDSDVDGGKISTLLIAFLYRFWPRLFAEKRVHITRSPIIISTKGTKTEWCFDVSKAEDFKSKLKGYNHRYIKGLGQMTEAEYSRVLNDPVFDTISIDNKELLDMMFSGDSGPRKLYMMA